MKLVLELSSSLIVFLCLSAALRAILKLRYHFSRESSLESRQPGEEEYRLRLKRAA